MSGGEAHKDEVTAALRRLLAWPQIARSQQLSRFLEYIVDKRLNDESHVIKAYAIAVDVFGRPPDFDPQTDPIVRVQARRLRGLIERYYQSAGAADPLRILLPVGRYIPDFVPAELSPAKPTAAEAEEESEREGVLADEGLPPAERGQLIRSWLGLAGVTVALIVLVLILSLFGNSGSQRSTAQGVVHPPVVTIMEFQSLTGNVADVRLFAGLAVELVTDLEQFETMTVRYGGAATASPPEGAEGLDAADYVLSGIVRRDGARLQYGAILTEVQTGTVVWNRSLALESFQTGRSDLLDHVSGMISRVLGGPRGPLHARARTQLESQDSFSGQATPYMCRVLFDLYRERRTAASAEKARRCLAALDEQGRATGQAFAAVASLGIEAMDTGVQPDGMDRLVLAEQMLARALELSPTSGFVWEQRARAFATMGQHEAAEAAFSSSMQLNPSNTDAMAAEAWHLTMSGKLEDGLARGRAALDGDPEPPAWYYCGPALALLQRRDFERAVDYAERCALADRELGPVLAVMAGQGLRQADIVNRYLPRVLEVPSFRSGGILPRFRNQITDAALVDAIGAALAMAGVPEAALNQSF